MIYKLVVTERAEELLDNLLLYLAVNLKNKSAAAHLLDGIESIYLRLQENPLQFPFSQDPVLLSKGYHVAIVPEMSYIVIFSISEDIVNVVGFFHSLEDYGNKI
ncbi:MAG: type II toxin-antitoxin system RelE/ParE family toxin [Clostridiales bacterium]|nr:type II toxin-antitoxin system RelE/ParE family toxin [Clostridiales bacterium]